MYKEYEKLPDNISEHRVRENWDWGFHSKKELLTRALNPSNNPATKKSYNKKHIAYLIGEIEGAKWLTEQGYEVYQFGFIQHYFDVLNNTVERMKKRRKKEHIENDEDYIQRLEQTLKSFFGEQFETMRQFYNEVLPIRKEIRKTVQFAEQVGGVFPDFIIKKDTDFSIVEVKANSSMPTKHQQMCFEIAKKYGFKAMVLRVIVESNVAKEIRLLECK